jgi:hypothetical protein
MISETELPGEMYTSDKLEFLQKNNYTMHYNASLTIRQEKNAKNRQNEYLNI